MILNISRTSTETPPILSEALSSVKIEPGEEDGAALPVNRSTKVDLWPAQSHLNYIDPFTEQMFTNHDQSSAVVAQAQK